MPFCGQPAFPAIEIFEAPPGFFASILGHCWKMVRRTRNDRGMELILVAHGFENSNSAEISPEITSDGAIRGRAIQEYQNGRRVREAKVIFIIGTCLVQTRSKLKQFKCLHRYFTACGQSIPSCGPLVNLRKGGLHHAFIEAFHTDRFSAPESVAQTDRATSTHKWASRVG